MDAAYLALFGLLGFALVLGVSLGMICISDWIEKRAETEQLRLRLEIERAKARRASSSPALSSPSGKGSVRRPA